ncbi:MAG: hypothetical protein WDZ35_13875 [Crocinitomicaceae bacterium]
MKKWFIFIPVCSFLFCLTFLSCTGEESEEEVDTTSHTTMDFSDQYDLTSIRRHFPQADVPLKELEVDASDDHQIILGSGSFIDIPKNGFIDAEGNPVKGAVNLSYREFNNPTDFMASGIPMALSGDENGVELFKSAGMIEIKATADGKEVFPSEENKIKVGFASNQKGDYPLYRFEEGKGWEKMDNIATYYQDQIDSINNIEIPDYPALISDKITLYHITKKTVDSKPSLAKYEGMSFTPVDYKAAKKVQARYIKDIDIKPLRNRRYMVTVTQHFEDPVPLICKLAYKKGEYEKKVKQWQGEFGEIHRFQQSLNAAKDSLKKAGNNAVRATDLNYFGILNCDEAEREEFANYTYSVNGEKDVEWRIYCLDYTRRAKYPCTMGKKIGIEPKNAYAIIALDEENNKYVSSVTECRNAFSNNHFKFNPKKVEDDITMQELGFLLNDE